MTTAELFKKARKIEIAARRLVDEQLAGQYHSVFKGRGLIFSDVRPYYAGDDVRSIDWNITARMNAPHVKQFVEERDRTVNLMVDMSASGYFGSRGESKRELAAELAAVVAFSAIKNNDRVGLYIVTDKVERFVPPKKGRRHVLRVIGEILAFEPLSRGTNLATGLDLLGKIARRRSVVFLVSDFLSEGWERPMQIARQRHELVPVVVGDPLESELPSVGLLVLEDLESGEVIELDTSSYARHDFARRARQAALVRDQTLRRLNVDTVEINTDQSYVDALIAFFKARAKRMAHG
ncbi:MAG: DUF58 domain-containing protein [Deltaproteobacteria bacterium]|nr:DUF58 domain-containing protein [Deltaproteobacteria bacterium]MCW5804210.1 DUF58 domain-containing protein [Deltaproteobacteria bacterium]